MEAGGDGTVSDESQAEQQEYEELTREPECDITYIHVYDCRTQQAGEDAATRLMYALREHDLIYARAGFTPAARAVGALPLEIPDGPPPREEWLGVEFLYSRNAFGEAGQVCLAWVTYDSEASETEPLRWHWEIADGIRIQDRYRGLKEGYSTSLEAGKKAAEAALNTFRNR